MTNEEDVNFEEGFEEVERELGNEEVVIDVPFDPNKIKVISKPYSVGQIVQDLEDKVIDLDTEFQRLPNLWDDTKKSRFIESLILNLPIPSFYFNEKENNDWEVIDGLQRISTISSFILEKKLTLTRLEFLKEYDNKKFDDLPNALQKRITRFSINTCVIEKGTPVEVKLNIFKRVNTGGLTLTPQEIRHALNQGLPADLIADLVRWKDEINPLTKLQRTRKNTDGSVIPLTATPEGTAFARVTEHKIDPNRMEDRDFANRFVAFYLIPYQEYEPDLNTFLNKGMAKIKNLSKQEVANLKTNFREGMNLAQTIFGNDAFRKRFNIKEKRKPINKALFEVLSVNFAQLSLESKQLLSSRKEVFKNKLIKLHNEPSGKFVRSISQGTAQKDLVNERFTAIERIIKETLND